MITSGGGELSLDNAFDLRLGNGGWGLAAVALGLVMGFAVLSSRRVDAPAEAEAEVRGPTADVTADV